MTSASYDVGVIGLGATGSATAYQVAKRGRSVVAFDRYAPPHTIGSTHGRTRIIREACWEHPTFVPLVRRAYELWDELAREVRRPLMQKTGGIMIGPEASELVSGARASAIEYKVPHRMLSAAALRLRFPGFDPLDDWVALVEARAGVLFPELCVQSFLERATAHGAAVHYNDAVIGWEPDGAGVVIRTANGSYRAGRLVLAAGPWMRELVPDLVLPLAVERQVQHWFEPTVPELFAAARCPVTLWEYRPGHNFAVVPDFGDGIKLTLHHQGELTTAETVRRDVSPQEDAAALDLLRRFLPRAKGVKLESTVCLYTNTPDSQFLIDAHPVHPQVIIASPCSGHGFKFSSAIGELLADVATDRPPRFDMSVFGLRRFA